MLTSRRKFLLGAASLLAAPSIVRAQSLMPVRVIEPPLYVPKSPAFDCMRFDHVRKVIEIADEHRNGACGCHGKTLVELHRELGEQWDELERLRAPLGVNLNS